MTTALDRLRLAKQTYDGVLDEWAEVDKRLKAAQHLLHAAMDEVEAEQSRQRYMEEQAEAYAWWRSQQ